MQSLSFVVWISIAAYITIGASVFAYEVTRGSPFYLIAIYPLGVLINIFFEYGLEIIESSSLEKVHAPIFSANIVGIASGKGRFFRQMVMLLAFLGLVYQFYVSDLTYFAAIVLCFLALALPSSFALNALYENLFEILNPISLIGFALLAGWDYLLAVIILALSALVFYGAYQIGPWIFLLYLPFGLYCLLLYFRFLGLIALKQMPKLFPVRDYQQEENVIDQQFENNTNLHEFIKKVYWQMKENQIAEVIEKIDPVIKLSDWARFDFLFDSISEWPNKTPALHFTREYIPHLLEKKNGMKALSLCQWALKQDPGFDIGNEETLDTLQLEAASNEQFVVVVKLLENFVTENSNLPSSRRLLSLAADICQSKLHHQEKVNQLLAKLEELA